MPFNFVPCRRSRQIKIAFFRHSHLFAVIAVFIRTCSPGNGKYKVHLNNRALRLLDHKVTMLIEVFF